MNLCDRVYFAIHAALTLLVCVYHQRVEHWPVYVAWNLVAMAAIDLLARQQQRGRVWEFAHGWLPALFFITVFEQVSFLSLTLRGEWQNPRVVAFESLLFGVPPIVWMHARAASHIHELLEFGYAAFYPMYPIVGGLFWRWRERPDHRGAFRRLTDALSIGYLLCYATYLLLPTQSPANALARKNLSPGQGGPFGAAVNFIQHHAGVHGNAFPSSHIMLAFVVLVFTYRYLPRAAPWLLLPVLLMCVGAVFDGYHYASDVFVGALLGIVVGTLFALRRSPPRTS
jgi:membrane-associated phospholipid phosphatase